MAQQDRGNGDIYTSLLKTLEAKAEQSVVEPKIHDLTKWMQNNFAQATDDEKLALYKKVREVRLVPPEAAFLS